MTDPAYLARCRIEQADGVPRWPCPECGRDGWHVVHRDAHHASLSPVVCDGCATLQDAHWVDAKWCGMRDYARYPGMLTEFVSEHAAYLAATFRKPPIVPPCGH